MFRGVHKTLNLKILIHFILRNILLIFVRESIYELSLYFAFIEFLLATLNFNLMLHTLLQNHTYLKFHTYRTLKIYKFTSSKTKQKLLSERRIILITEKIKIFALANFVYAFGWNSKKFIRWNWQIYNLHFSEFS